MVLECLDNFDGICQQREEMPESIEEILKGESQ